MNLPRSFSERLCYNTLHIEGNDELINSINKLIFNAEGNLIFTTIAPLPRYVNSYWYLSNWGTEYQPLQTSKISIANKLTISFITIETPPINWIMRLHERFDLLSYQLCYYNLENASGGTFQINKEMHHNHLRSNL